MKTTKYNKATQHHIGRLKAKLARLKDEDKRRASSRGAKISYAVKKFGNATVALVGFPSVGKSTLQINAINVKKIYLILKTYSCTLSLFPSFSFP